jgi:hypothetical protein
MSTDGFAIDVHALTPTQLDDIELRAVERYNRMKSVTPNMGDITLAVAALVIEIIEEAYPENQTQVFIIAQDDVRNMVRSYLCRWKLMAFPYKNGALLEYVSYANFANIAACFG